MQEEAPCKVSADAQAAPEAELQEDVRSIPDSASDEIEATDGDATSEAEADARVSDEQHARADDETPHS